MSGWFRHALGPPSEVQRQAWPQIKAGQHTLIAAPTGSGKTLAAFLCAIDDLVREGESGPLPDETRVVYVSPLKALSNDIERNLQAPLAGILERLGSDDDAATRIRVGLRTGDTPSAARTAMVKRPPHILVTTPESLYLLATSAGGRSLLKTARVAIIDEIHAVMGSKRGSHLALTLERVEALAEQPLTRIGLSATQKPLAVAARFLTGTQGAADPATSDDDDACRIVDIGHTRPMELSIELPDSPLEAVMPNEVWEELYQRLLALICSHRTTLIFVNTRRLAERMTHNLSQMLANLDSEEPLEVAAHHGSLSKEQRHDAEQRLKSGKLRAIVATASLELGIDIGVVDLVCQFGSPKSIMAFLQRVGRSGHQLGATPRGRLFPLSRDELVECAALMRAVRAGTLDRIVVPERPLDILAQQVVAEVSCREWGEEELFGRLTRAYPYRDLSRDQFDAVVGMLAEGYSTSRGRRAAYLHHDAVNGRLRARRGAGLTALTNGGAIPDNFDFHVRLDPQDLFIGTINEDFAIESMPGDIFQLGNKSWEILKVETGIVRVADAHGKPPTMPFWLGEAPGRTDELSREVSALRTELQRLLAAPSSAGVEAEHARRAVAWVSDAIGISEAGAEQLVTYLHAGRNALTTMPTHQTLVMERFFDDAGDMHLVIHSPRGSRLNRAWGLALRKRFCRSFNFELQAAANEDAILLSLGQTHSFPLADVWRFLNSNTVRDVLVQALLDAPMFQVRFRWNAARALAVQRQRGGRRVPPYLQRMQAEDLVSLVFPDQLACLENITGEREIPDHPLVEQSIADCLTEAMDIDHLERLVADIEGGEVELVARDLREPSPFAQEIIAARPYAFLDDAPLEERRTQAIRNRRWLSPEEAKEFGTLDAAAIDRVREEAAPRVSDADELHDALELLTFIDAPAGDAAGWGKHFDTLRVAGRATTVSWPDSPAGKWVATERLPLWQAVVGVDLLQVDPRLEVPAASRIRTDWPRDEALREIVRGLLDSSGPITVQRLAAQIGVSDRDVDRALLSLETEGAAMRGHFSQTGADSEEWCERRLLARIHRYTLQRLRREIEPLSFDDYVRFVFEWQGIRAANDDTTLVPASPDALLHVVAQLEGVEAPVAAWEESIVTARLPDYDPAWLDQLCAGGELVWARMRVPPPAAAASSAGPLSSTPIAIVRRANADLWRSVRAESDDAAPGADQAEANGEAAQRLARLSSSGRAVADALAPGGALFADELQGRTGLLPTQVDDGLGELAAQGLATSDSFAGLRALVRPASARSPSTRARGSAARRAATRRMPGAARTPALPPWPHGFSRPGRWSLLPDAAATDGDPPPVEEVAWTLLHRYGVVFRRVLERESLAPPWRELARALRSLEARGNVRGGYFVSGVGGEQFALPEAIAKMRSVRRAGPSGMLRVLSAVDPAAVVGLRARPTLEQHRIAGGRAAPVAVRKNRVLFRDGVPIAALEAGKVTFLEDPGEGGSSHLGTATEGEADGGGRLPAVDAWHLERLLRAGHTPTAAGAILQEAERGAALSQLAERGAAN